MSHGTLDPDQILIDFTYRIVTFCDPASQRCSAINSHPYIGPQPQISRANLVWPLPLSLAATQGIDVSFSSSGYLDVSVHRVPFLWLCIHHRIHTVCRMWVSPFGYLWINACLRLPKAFRSLPRPSSAPSAKASALCSL